jgi:hypothetical protein
VLAVVARCRVLEKRKCATFDGPETDPRAWDYFVHWHKRECRLKGQGIDGMVCRVIVGSTVCAF